MAVLTRTNYIPLPLILGPSIFHLLAQRSPSHIARLVVAIVVNTVKSMLRGWLASNVLQELFKGVEPKLNASAPVERIVFIVVPVAPITSIMIRGIFWGSSPCPIVPVDQEMAIMAETSAASNVTAGKIISSNNSNVTTVAEAIPPGLSTLGIIHSPDDCESAKFLACDIIELSHAVRPPLAYGLWLGSMGYLSNPSSRRYYSIKGGV